MHNSPHTDLLISPEFLPEARLRTEKIMQSFGNLDIDALLISDPINVYYATTRIFRGYVYLAKGHQPAYFVIRPTGVKGDNVFQIRKPEQIAPILAENGFETPHALGLEFDTMPYSDIERLQKAFQGTAFKNGSAALRNARMTKTDLEISMMREDGLHQCAVYRKIPKLWKPEMTDIELQIEIERNIRLEGGLGYTRTAGNTMEINMGSILHGTNADAPSPYDFALGGAGADPTLPVGADGSIIKPGEAIMVDMSGAFNGYQTDMTRVYSVGELPEAATRAHQCSINIHNEIRQIARPGVEICSLYAAAMRIVEQYHLTDYFMGHRQKAAFIGHGVGIQLNEMPVVTAKNRQPLEVNMTIAIEPKFVIPGVGAVGIENTYRVTPEGLDNLTPLPEEIVKL